MLFSYISWACECIRRNLIHQIQFLFENKELCKGEDTNKEVHLSFSRSSSSIISAHDLDIKEEVEEETEEERGEIEIGEDARDDKEE